eukprot:m.86880 g.86880  ORF g.86880 m.86880 type:complete len:63 (+) comp36518_c0_seq2:612-800(+)
MTKSVNEKILERKNSGNSNFLFNLKEHAVSDILGWREFKQRKDNETGKENKSQHDPTEDYLF